MPTHRDDPWLRDKAVIQTKSDPADPELSANLHVANQLKVIDDARQATSTAPPDTPGPDSR